MSQAVFVHIHCESVAETLSFLLHSISALVISSSTFTLISVNGEMMTILSIHTSILRNLVQSCGGIYDSERRRRGFLSESGFEVN